MWTNSEVCIEKDENEKERRKKKERMNERMTAQHKYGNEMVARCLIPESSKEQRKLLWRKNIHASTGTNDVERAQKRGWGSANGGINDGE